MAHYPHDLDPRTVLLVLTKARDLEDTGPDYQAYERAIDALTQHSVLKEAKEAAMGAFVDDFMNWVTASPFGKAEKPAPICWCGETDPMEQAHCGHKGCGMPVEDE